MRITFVLPCFDLSGGIRAAAAHAERLYRRGHQVLAIAPHGESLPFRAKIKSFVSGRGWPAPWEQGPSHFDGLAVPHRLLPRPGPVTAAELPEADVIISTWWETTEWVARLPRACGAHVHFVQGYEAFAGVPEIIDATYRRPVPKIVVSRWLSNLMGNKFRQPPLALVPNGVDPEQFHAPPRSKQPTPTIGFSYSAQPIKGYDLMLRAHALAVRRLPELKAVTMTNHRLVEGCPLPPGAEIIAGARDETLREAYARCDVWLSGTREEGFGLPLLEAMACRTPIVATPAGAAPELVAGGGGFLVPHEDPEAMAEGIVRVCTMQEDEWRIRSEAAFATARTFTWDAAARSFEEALHRALAHY